jgi:phosphatidylethanolamine/phosphatidyl-N-methylethanolamine N-methyltransferase
MTDTLEDKPAASSRWVFFLNWLRSPASTGAVTPSSRHLAGAMARQALARTGSDDAPVIELGGGTGSVTRALLEAGLPPDRLIVVERDARLFQLLRRSFPALKIVQGDAGNLVNLMAGMGITRAAGVVSGLPLLNMPMSVRKRIVDQSFALLGTGGAFVQFTYGFISPIAFHEHGLIGRLATRIWLNLPPAAVWLYQRPAIAKA